MTVEYAWHLRTQGDVSSFCKQVTLVVTGGFREATRLTQTFAEIHFPDRYRNYVVWPRVAYLIHQGRHRLAISTPCGNAKITLDEIHAGVVVRPVVEVEEDGRTGGVGAPAPPPPGISLTSTGINVLGFLLRCLLLLLCAMGIVYPIC